MLSWKNFRVDNLSLVDLEYRVRFILYRKEERFKGVMLWFGEDGDCRYFFEI